RTTPTKRNHAKTIGRKIGSNETRQRSTQHGPTPEEIIPLTQKN
ncbi:9503_t:CDS:1, partial [Gigaspora rosea]